MRLCFWRGNEADTLQMERILRPCVSLHRSQQQHRHVWDLGRASLSSLLLCVFPSSYQGLRSSFRLNKKTALRPPHTHNQHSELWSVRYLQEAAGIGGDVEQLKDSWFQMVLICSACRDLTCVVHWYSNALWLDEICCLQRKHTKLQRLCL